MRLICPNCDAQYEVPDDVMPHDGRDVQCSNCGQTWFQEHPDTVAEAEAAKKAEAAPDEEVVRPDDEGVADDAEAPKAEGEAAEATPEPEPEPEPDDEGAVEPPLEETPPPQPARRSLDPDIANVLREEAELETQARQNEVSGTVESQPDLGLNEAEGSDEARKRAREARDRMARMRGEDPADVPLETAAAIGSRRDLLPDIEEINSTLRSNSDRSPGEDPGQTAQIEVREKRSFGRGFMLMVILALILAVLYVYAPKLADTVPQADPWISAYVGAVDQGRMWLDAQVEGVLNWLDAAADSSSR
ncbi:zinc-ribbon domain-containing protein [Roseobacter sp. YSTF-M11]|uniref:Zinc-ribbon domain-containing protein n=1 Tax=Roseobacter insulae TaxID=2859783 RepID=A0A9X1FXU6_9RHOB|nr:zinc-ribbon domain-containing protein [Roseobacter insulae]MBW4709701.1 zinc-ribbon domain-containing protein [Roseobacter insulae]